MAVDEDQGQNSEHWIPPTPSKYSYIHNIYIIYILYEHIQERQNCLCISISIAPRRCMESGVTVPHILYTPTLGGGEMPCAAPSIAHITQTEYSVDLLQWHYNNCALAIYITLVLRRLQRRHQLLVCILNNMKDSRLSSSCLQNKEELLQQASDYLIMQQRCLVTAPDSLYNCTAELYALPQIISFFSNHLT